MFYGSGPALPLLRRREKRRALEGKGGGRWWRRRAGTRHGCAGEQREGDEGLWLSGHAVALCPPPR